MKTNYIFLLLLILTTSFAYSQTDKIDINGVWADLDSPAENSTIVISELNGKVIFVHYMEWKGQKFVEAGIGKRNGNTIEYKVEVTSRIEGWATAGIHKLILSEDGKTLKGTYKDNLKREGPIGFVRVR